MKSDESRITPSSEDSLGIDIRKASDQMLAHWLLKQLCGYDDRDIVSDRERDESFVAEIIGRVKTSIALSERGAWVESEKQLPPFGQRVLGCWLGEATEIDVAIYAGEWQDPENEDDTYAQPKFWMSLPEAPK
jgi:hypothetical protein